MHRLRSLAPLALISLLLPQVGFAAPAASTDLPAIALMKQTRPLVIAHRGYSGIAPENTLPSYELAIAAGAGEQGLELVERGGVGLAAAQAGTGAATGGGLER